MPEYTVSWIYMSQIFRQPSNIHANITSLFLKKQLKINNYLCLQK